MARRSNWRLAGARVLAMAAWLAGAALPAAARADSSLDAAVRAAPDDASVYRNAIRDGVAEYDAGHYEEARSLFRRAHELQPNARTFRGLGMTSFELRDYVAAVRNLSAALQDKRKALTPDQRKETQDLLDRARQFIDVYTIKVVPPDARLTVDGHTAELEPDGTLLFGFGMHTVEARAPNLAPAWSSIDVRGGERKDLVLTLSPPLPLPTRPPAGPPLPGETRIRSRPSNVGPAVWLLSGAAAAALAGGTGYWWYRQQSQLDDCRHPPDPNLRCTSESTLTTQRNLALGTTLAVGAVAVTAIVIGVATWNTAPSARRSLACAPAGNGITCSGVF